MATTVDTDRSISKPTTTTIVLDPVVVATSLLDGSYCSSDEEADLLTEIILNDFVVQSNENDIPKKNDDRSSVFASCLSEHLDISISQANELSNRILGNDKTSNKNASFVDSHSKEKHDDDEQSSNGLEFDDDNDEEIDDGGDGELLGEGECELCDRYIKLTKHHLIPRSTWPKVSKLLERSLTLHRKGETQKALERLGPGLEDRLEELSNDSTSSNTSSNQQKIKLMLQTTCDVCRQCHNCVHKTHSNLELALWYNTVDKLIVDKQISKFCKWANKQRPPRENMIGNIVRR